MRVPSACRMNKGVTGMSDPYRRARTVIVAPKKRQGRRARSSMSKIRVMYCRYSLVRVLSRPLIEGLAPRTPLILEGPAPQTPRGISPRRRTRHLRRHLSRKAPARNPVSEVRDARQEERLVEPSAGKSGLAVP